MPSSMSLVRVLSLGNKVWAEKSMTGLSERFLVNMQKNLIYFEKFFFYSITLSHEYSVSKDNFGKFLKANDQRSKHLPFGEESFISIDKDNSSFSGFIRKSKTVRIMVTLQNLITRQDNDLFIGVMMDQIKVLSQAGFILMSVFCLFLLQSILKV